MFAVFDRHCARPPECLQSRKENYVSQGGNPGEGYDRASHHLRAIRRLRYGTASPEARPLGALAHDGHAADFQEFYCGPVLSDHSSGAFRGGGAVAYSKSAPVTFAYATGTDNQLPAVVVCTGSIKNTAEVRALYGLPEVPNQSAANLVLDLYCNDFSDVYGDGSDQPATCLSVLDGDWSFVLFDSGQQYLLVGQSGNPRHNLHWGTAQDDGALIISSEPEVLKVLCSSNNGGPAHFPPGCYFENDGFLNPTYESGTIFSFNRPKSRRPVHPVLKHSRSHNRICSITFRTQSNTDLCSLANTHAM